MLPRRIFFDWWTYVISVITQSVDTSRTQLQHLSIPCWYQPFVFHMFSVADAPGIYCQFTCEHLRDCTVIYGELNCLCVADVLDYPANYTYKRTYITREFPLILGPIKTPNYIYERFCFKRKITINRATWYVLYVSLKKLRKTCVQYFGWFGDERKWPRMCTKKHILQTVSSARQETLFWYYL